MAIVAAFIIVNDIFFPKQVLGPELKAKNLCEGSYLIFPVSSIHLSGLNSWQSSPHKDFILPMAYMLKIICVLESTLCPLGRVSGSAGALALNGTGGYNLKASSIAAWR
uniref:Uncharacterized protein n=1 Tax=Opuntia streptacantha TaxID=393608 RepID=A0A7C9A9N9_OPUST